MVKWINVADTVAYSVTEDIRKEYFDANSSEDAFKKVFDPIYMVWSAVLHAIHKKALD